MNQSLRTIGERIIENRYELTNVSMKLRMEENPDLAKEMVSRQPKTITMEEGRELSALFVKYLGEALFGDQKLYFKLVTEWGKKAGKIAIQEEFPLDETLEGTRFFRVAILQLIKEEGKKINITIDDIIEVCSIIDPLLDQCVYCFSLAYTEHNNTILKNAYEKVQELMMPIVPISNGVAVLPILGELDEERSQYILENALEQSKNLKVEHLIIDLSGIVIIDTMVAHNLFRVVNALKLLGVQSMITGMRSELTQTVVSIGIDFKDLLTFSNLQKALESIGFTRESQKV